jgi:hypothetical protein
LQLPLRVRQRPKYSSSQQLRLWAGRLTLRTSPGKDRSARQKPPFHSGDSEMGFTDQSTHRRSPIRSSRRTASPTLRRFTSAEAEEGDPPSAAAAAVSRLGRSSQIEPGDCLSDPANQPVARSQNANSLSSHDIVGGPYGGWEPGIAGAPRSRYGHRLRA